MVKSTARWCKPIFAGVCILWGQFNDIFIFHALQWVHFMRTLKKKNNFTIWKNEPVGFAWSYFMGWQLLHFGSSGRRYQDGISSAGDLLEVVPVGRESGVIKDGLQTIMRVWHLWKKRGRKIRSGEPWLPVALERVLDSPEGQQDCPLSFVLDRSDIVPGSLIWAVIWE